MAKEPKPGLKLGPSARVRRVANVLPKGAALDVLSKAMADAKLAGLRLCLIDIQGGVAIGLIGVRFDREARRFVISESSAAQGAIPGSIEQPAKTEDADKAGFPQPAVVCAGG